MCVCVCWGGGGGSLERGGRVLTFTDEHPGCFLVSENFQLEIPETFWVRWNGFFAI